jgi:hypothetical protein
VGKGPQLIHVTDAEKAGKGKPTVGCPLYLTWSRTEKTSDSRPSSNGA